MCSVNISNSYANTAKLMKQFPVLNSTPVETAMEQKIQNRLLNGFENWNRGYDTWQAWGDILYTPDSMYNLNSVRLTLKEYQMSQKLGLSAEDIQMGNFQNMIICGDWCAIRYDISSTHRKTGAKRDGTVMEFVRFKDYGGAVGTCVVEGWAGTRGKSTQVMTRFQTEEERAAQQAAWDAVVNAVIPNTDDLEEKYPVKYPTPAHSDLADKMRLAILTDFDHWNQGYDVWAAWADTYYDDDMIYQYEQRKMTLKEYKASVAEESKIRKTTRISFDSMLLSGDWAAIHYRTTVQDAATGAVSADDTMQFLHFAQRGDQVKVIACWTK